MSGVPAWDNLHLRDETSPVVLLRKIHTHIRAIPVNRANHAHTLVSDGTPFVSGEGKGEVSGGVARTTRISQHSLWSSHETLHTNFVPSFESQDSSCINVA